MSISSLSWHNLNVVVTDVRSKKSTNILSSNTGIARAGQVLALVGPSGAGKSTLLSALAQRSVRSIAVSGQIFVNGVPAQPEDLRRTARFVEQEDHFLGSLTLRETISFAAQLCPASSDQQADRTTEIIHAFGLSKQQDLLVSPRGGKGLSGGQRKRLGVACQVITAPSILLLDEPTSGLDSKAGLEVMSYIKKLAEKHHLIVIAAIHQPSTDIFNLFDDIMLLSHGQTCHFGKRSEVVDYFSRIGHETPQYTNPAEFLLHLANDEFIEHDTSDLVDSQMATCVVHIADSWRRSPEHHALLTLVSNSKESLPVKNESKRPRRLHKPVFLKTTGILFRRNWIKSYRDITPYMTRLALYFALGIVMGTVWLRLTYHQSDIFAFLTCSFFAGAFMSLVAVLSIPSAVEDYNVFRKERANGLYGPLPFMLAGFLIGVPYLFLISVVFWSTCYWLINLNPTPVAFVTAVMWLFLELLAAENLVIFIVCVKPNFVISLAALCLLNALWMSCAGFMVSVNSMNVFWRIFYHIDYQTYYFKGVIWNQFRDTIYDCSVLPPGSGASQYSEGTQYQCMYRSDLNAQGQIRGTAILDMFGISTNPSDQGRWAATLLGITLVYRLLGYLALRANRFIN